MANIFKPAQLTTSKPEGTKHAPHGQRVHITAVLTGGDDVPAPFPVASRLAKKLRGSGGLVWPTRGDWVGRKAGQHKQVCRK